MKARGTSSLCLIAVVFGQKAKDLMDDDWQVLSTNTSYEYVIRVVAQKYNVTTSRARGG